MALSKDNTQVLRGLAILSIILHNFLHLPQFGFAAQNESSFTLQNTKDFLAGWGDGVLPVIGHVISFIGWVGVPVFIFLSGYGLVMKYERGNHPFSVCDHIVSSWKKLFCLMFPAVIYFMLPHLHNGFYLLKSVLSLTMLTNLFIHVFPPDPGVYWYFGLAFELYLLYLFFHKFRSSKVLWISGCVVLALAGLLEHTRYLRSFFLWLGGLSGCLFVVHPIARGVVVRLLLDKAGLPVLLPLYLILAFAFALAYRYLYGKLRKLIGGF